MTDLSLLSISAISFYLLGNNVTSCHRQRTHCHCSNLVDLLIVLIIRNTDDKSWDAHFHILWQDFTVQMCNIYCLIITHFLYFFLNLIIQGFCLTTIQTPLLQVVKRFKLTSL